MTTDKVGHGYTEAYQEIAVGLAPSDGYAAVEIGIAGGEGALWLRDLLRRFGQLVSLVGVDIDQRRTNPAGPTIHIDARNPNLRDRVRDAIPAGCPLGLVVDDGAHTPDTILAAYDALWPLVAPGGYYVVEDWSHANMIGVQAIQALIKNVDAYGDIDRLTLTREGLAIFRKLPVA